MPIYSQNASVNWKKAEHRPTNLVHVTITVLWCVKYPRSWVHHTANSANMNDKVWIAESFPKKYMDRSLLEVSVTWWKPLALVDITAGGKILWAVKIVKQSRTIFSNIKCTQNRFLSDWRSGGVGSLFYQKKKQQQKELTLDLIISSVTQTRSCVIINGYLHAVTGGLTGSV